MDIRENISSGKRLIDADAFLEKMKRTSRYFDVMFDVEEMPTVDAVEVVRCRECKKGEIDDPDFPDEYYCHEGCGWNNGDFYCSYGERKEGAD